MDVFETEIMTSNHDIVIVSTIFGNNGNDDRLDITNFPSSYSVALPTAEDENNALENRSISCISHKIHSRISTYFKFHTV